MITFTRDSTKDIINEPTVPVLLYTASTTLETGMALYDNTGTDTGYRVGEVLNETSFNLYQGQRVLDIEGFSYTIDGNNNVILETYMGTNTNIVMPEIKEI